MAAIDHVYAMPDGSSRLVVALDYGAQPIVTYHSAIAGTFNLRAPASRCTLSEFQAQGPKDLGLVDSRRLDF